MELVTVVALSIVGIAFVVAPLRRRQAAPETDPVLDELVARKRVALEAVIDLESEHAVGKISDDDFGHLHATYEAEAIAVLDEIDALGSAQVGDELEAEIAAVRAQLERGICPRCGARRPPESRCARCGA